MRRPPRQIEREKGRKIVSFLVVLVILAASTAALWAWHGQNRIPSGHDGYPHASRGLKIGLALAEGGAATLEALRTLPARYSPLTYLLTGSLLQVVPVSWKPFSLTTLLFWVLTLAGLAVWGSGRRTPAGVLVFPLLVCVANPVFWRIGTAYNLEMALSAGAAWSLALAARADLLRSRFSLAAAMVLLMLLAFTKTVLILFFLPFGLALVVFGEPALRVRRVWLVGAFVAAWSLWALWHAETFASEWITDLYALQGATAGGSWFYLKTILVSYRGLPLLAVLAVLLVQQVAQRNVRGNDAAYAIAVAVPLAVLSLVASKYSWYALPVYTCLAVWLAEVVGRQWDRLWVRFPFTIVAGGYLALAIGQCLFHFYPAAPIGAWGRLLAVTAPQPPLAAELLLADETARWALRYPGSLTVLDEGRLATTHERMGVLLLMAQPRPAALPDVKMGWNANEFLRDLLRAQTFLSVNDQWPRLDRLAVTPIADPARRERFEQLLLQARESFVLERTHSLSETLAVNIYRRRSPEPPQTATGPDDPPWTPEREAIHRQAGREALAKNDYREARKHFFHLYRQWPRDCPALKGLAVTAAEIGSAGWATELWGQLATRCEALSFKIEALPELTRLAEKGGVAADADDRYFRHLVGECEKRRDLSWDLWSQRLTLELRRGREAETAEAFTQLRRLAEPAQLPALSLTEAQWLAAHDRAGEAVSRLAGQIETLAPGDSSYSALTLALSRMLAASGDPRQAERWLRTAAELPGDRHDLAISAIAVAAALTEDGAGEPADDLLSFVIPRLSGQDRGLILIEQGKSALQKQRLTEAARLFTEAGQTPLDPLARQWVEQTLAEISPVAVK